MYRYAMEEMYKWKDSPRRGLLIIEGARQVGKTWLAREFGRIAYEETVYIDLGADRKMAELFSGEPGADRIIMALEIYIGKKLSPENTLIIFDEVQAAPRALQSLAELCKGAPRYHMICVSPVSGAAPGSPDGAEVLKLHPLSYMEFLLATGNEQLAAPLDSLDFQAAADLKNSYIDTLGQYFFVGGMPEAVLRFSQNKDFNEVREIHRRILDSYEQEVSRHAPPGIVQKLRAVWSSIPSQLAKENKKFIYGLLREGARAKDYEAVISWLTDRGLLLRLCRVTDPGTPLREHADLKTFKLYLADIGLLGCMAGLQPGILLDGSRIFTEFRGALTEQYVMQQLSAMPGLDIFYYTNERSACEIAFLADNGKHIVPVEVRAEIDLRSKSLKVYREKYSPRLCIRTALTDYRAEEGLIDLPLYAIEKLS